MEIKKSVYILNDSTANLFIVIDPPCGEYELMPKDVISISITTQQKIVGDEQDFVFRYQDHGVINVDIGINNEILVKVNNEDPHRIWGQ